MELVRLIKTCLVGTYSKNLSDAFPIQKGMKQGQALSSLLFNSASDYVMRKGQEN
jgi:hypothetical protein